MTDPAKLSPAEATQHIRRHMLRPLLAKLLDEGVRPWVLVQALEGELADLEREANRTRQDRRAK